MNFITINKNILFFLFIFIFFNPNIVNSNERFQIGLQYSYPKWDSNLTQGSYSRLYPEYGSLGPVFQAQISNKLCLLFVFNKNHFEKVNLREYSNGYHVTKFDSDRTELDLTLNYLATSYFSMFSGLKYLYYDFLRLEISDTHFSKSYTTLNASGLGIGVRGNFPKKACIIHCYGTIAYYHLFFEKKHRNQNNYGYENDSMDYNRNDDDSLIETEFGLNINMDKIYEWLPIQIGFFYFYHEFNEEHEQYQGSGLNIIWKF